MNRQMIHGDKSRLYSCPRRRHVGDGTHLHDRKTRTFLVARGSLPWRSHTRHGSGLHVAPPTER